MAFKANKYSGGEVLELGPLEGGHTYMLEKLGGAKVLSIESNANSFVKCLIVKNMFGLSVQFLLGDFVKYLERTDAKYDLCMASGILYHMIDPIGVLKNISRLSDQVFLWTHYYNPEREDIANQFGETEETLVGEKKVNLVKHFYGDTNYTTFCGGVYHFSYWMYKQELLDVLDAVGFKDITIAHDQMDHPNGSCICLLGKK